MRVLRAKWDLFGRILMQHLAAHSVEICFQIYNWDNLIIKIIKMKRSNFHLCLFFFAQTSARQSPKMGEMKKINLKMTAAQFVCCFGSFCFYLCRTMLKFINVVICAARVKYLLKVLLQYSCKKELRKAYFLASYQHFSRSFRGGSQLCEEVFIEAKAFQWMLFFLWKYTHSIHSLFVIKALIEHRYVEQLCKLITILNCNWYSTQLQPFARRTIARWFS